MWAVVSPLIVPIAITASISKSERVATASVIVWSAATALRILSRLPPLSVSVLLLHVEGEALEVVELRVDVLVGLLQDLDEVVDEAELLFGQEGVGDALFAGTASAADAVDVVFDAGRHVVIDNNGYILYIEASGGDICRHEHVAHRGGAL